MGCFRSSQEGYKPSDGIRPPSEPIRLDCSPRTLLRGGQGRAEFLFSDFHANFLKENRQNLFRIQKIHVLSAQRPSMKSLSRMLNVENEYTEPIHSILTGRGLHCLSRGTSNLGN